MAARSWEWWYATAPNGLLMSVSQYKLSKGCLRRWGFRHLLKLREEMGPAAARGDGHHREMELWDKLRKLPSTKSALAALRYAPAPGYAESEVAVRVDCDGAGWIGFIDLVYDWEGVIGLGKGCVKGLTSTGHTVIHDWKFTGNLKNAMTEDELLVDEAAILYAAEAYMGGARLVSCRWVYVEMNCPSPRAKEVWVYMPLEHVAARIEEMSANVLESNKLVQLHRKGELNVQEDLECNTGECFAFRRECPYKAGHDLTHERIKSGEIKGCEPTSRLRMPAPPGESMNDFKTAMSAFPGAAPKTPPAIPPKAPPKLPPKAPSKPEEADLSDEEADALVKEHMAAQKKTAAYHSDPNPVVERGFVNSNAAPVNPPASPEEAAIAQGVKPPEAAVVEEDDLTLLSKDQLRAVCGLEGIDLAKKRPQEATLRNMIRVARIQRAAGAQPIPSDVTEIVNTQGEVVETRDTSEDTRVFTKEEAAEIASILDKTDEPVKKLPPKVPQKPAEEPTPLRPGYVPAALTLAQIKEVVEGEVNVTNFVVKVTELHDIVNAATETLHAKKGVRDFRHIEYTGSADLCLAVQDLFESGEACASVVVFDSRTPEGSVLKTTLIALARQGLFKLVDGQLI